MAEEPYAVQGKQQQHRQPHHQPHQQNHVMLHGHHQIHTQQIHAPAPPPAIAAATNREVGQHNLPHSSPLDRFPAPHGNGRGLSLSLHHQNHQQHKSPLQHPQQHSQELAARVLPPASKARADGGTPGHGRDDAWTEGATLALIDAWGERYLHLNRGNLKQKHWREVADEVTKRSCLDESSSGRSGKSDVQCKNRLDTLKKKYKIEKARLASEGSPSKWPFFVKLDELIGPSKKGKKRSTPPPSNNGIAPAAAAAAALTATPVSRDQSRNHRQQQAQQAQATSNDSSSREFSAGMTDSCENNGNATAANEGRASSSKRRKVEGSFKDLARAIIKFGEVYERIESAKQQQLMDLERQRMEFTKDLELQRMQLFMQTQVELAKMKHGKLGGGGGGAGGGNTEHYL
ncbi:trihelix transcription factor ASIL2-like [Selaginella moellendorffii]|uniref:trihelix transcription factor ASIL2-like n=1 Tax=Selaginella moellendorffii TaxID=88036 RepID=UPI000D1C3B10|nr:trihelix transcription factor ASIL2-like [Selaginella moellendorffii]|eukprot:XP_024531829.1 trihelix transcription factor ASIL2-like [Selaginella moellendorffii]